jgi:hypothetical protein
MIRGSIFGWSTAATRRLCRDWRVNGGLGADVLWHEIGMLALAVTRSLDLNQPADHRNPPPGEFYFGTWSAPLKMDRITGRF